LQTGYTLLYTLPRDIICWLKCKVTIHSWTFINSDCCWQTCLILRKATTRRIVRTGSV